MLKYVGRISKLITVYWFCILVTFMIFNIDTIFLCMQCTPDYAYGSGGFPAWGIQPNSVLVFEIEVLKAT